MTDTRGGPAIIAIGVVLVGVIGGLFISGHDQFVAALLTGTVVTLGSLVVVNRQQEDRQFVVRLWLLAVGLRILSALAIYQLGLRDRLAPDWETYDFFGSELTRYWQEGGLTGAAWITSDIARYRSGWGMYYFVGAIYYVIGRNPLALQLVCGVAGANACVLVYKISRMVYPVQRVARLSTILATFSPSLIMWCSQGLKEPLIVFLLAAVLFLTLRLTHKLSLADGLLLLVCMLCLYSLRHYVVYVVFLAVAASLVFAARKLSPARMMQGSAAVIVLGLVFAYYGAGEVASRSLDLSRIQAGRQWSARASESGYGGNVDITDTRQALAYLPIGTVFFLFAPFPWMIRNLNHLIALPEMILWWAAAPFLFRGFWHSFRRRLRPTLAICLFTAGLTTAYALYLTNFGTAHRMRVQIFSFFIIFVSIGWHQFYLSRVRRRVAKMRPGGYPVRLSPPIAAGRPIPNVRDRWSH